MENQLHLMQMMKDDPEFLIYYRHKILCELRCYNRLKRLGKTAEKYEYSGGQGMSFRNIPMTIGTLSVTMVIKICPIFMMN